MYGISEAASCASEEMVPWRSQSGAEEFREEAPIVYQERDGRRDCRGWRFRPGG